jgi:hypothetical protein
MTIPQARSAYRLLNLSLDPRPARAPTSLRAIKLAGDKLTVPSQDSVRRRYALASSGNYMTWSAMMDSTQPASC